MDSLDAAQSDRAIDRRHLLRIGAWAAPAIVLASAVPAAAASVTTSSLLASSFRNTVESFGGYIHHEPATPGGTVEPTGTLTIVVSVPPGYTFTRSDTSAAWTGPASIAGGTSGTYVHVPAPGQHGAYGGTNSIFGGYTGAGDFVGQGSAVITAQSPTVQGTAVPTGATTVAHGSATPLSTIPASKLIVQEYALNDVDTAGAHLGPLAWAGGQIRYSGAFGDPDPGHVVWSEVLYGPGGEVLVSRSGRASIALYGSFPLSSETFGTYPMAPGTYTLRVTAYGNDAPVSAELSVTLG